MSIGHVQKTLGRRRDSEAAYKAALALRSGHRRGLLESGGPQELCLQRRGGGGHAGAAAQRPAGSARTRPSCISRSARHSSSAQQYAEAFAHYAQGNALRRLDAPFDIESFERRSARIRAVFDAPFFAARAGSGDPSRAPIFIVGLPRSGSTLIEQILASHSRVEGTMELPNILNIVREFDDLSATGTATRRRVGTLPAPQLRCPRPRATSRRRRRCAPGREHFTDKLPNNFSHVGLIHAILPHATIIDARRHPMDCVLQHLQAALRRGTDLQLRPGGPRSLLPLLPVAHGSLGRGAARQGAARPVRGAGARSGGEHPPPARALRARLRTRLPEFPRRRARSVRTASAEQVRQPIYTSGVGYWRHFEQELEPLRRALGDSLERFG